MDKPTASISRFLQEQLHYPPDAALARLDQVAGERIGRTEFLSDMAAARAAIEPWMPLFYLPVASTSDGVGLHLRPADVRTYRIAFCAAQGPGQFIETALSLEQLVYRGLLGQEGYGNGGKMPASFAPSVARANQVFGDAYYQPGRHGEFYSGDESTLMLEVFGGSPEAIHTEAVLAEAPAARLALWERGIRLGTESLALYAGAARVHAELGDRRQAAECVARSLLCYHHTAYEVDLNEYMAFGKPLLHEFPTVFSEDAAWQLQTPDPRLWAKRAHALFEAGQVERADKLLNDLCHGTGDYSAAVGAFRKHYEALGWDWALALCALRA